MGSNVALMQSLYARFATGDVPAVLGMMAPDIVWREAENHPYADGNPYVGPQAVLEGVFMRCVTEIDGFTVTPEEFLDAGDTVLVRGRYTGVAKATGLPLDAPLMHVWRIKDGAIVRYDQFTDTRGWAHALGVS